MKTREDIESYLDRAGAAYEQVAPDVWVVRGDHGVEIVVSIRGPVAVFRVKVMPAPARKRDEFFGTLLALNATEMLHGAYGLENGAVVVTDALQLENLDYNEFLATLDDIGLALVKHLPRLRSFAE